MSNTKIQIDYNGKDYVLEFTKDSVRWLQQKGFDIEKISSETMDQVPLLFQGALKANHGYVKLEYATEVFTSLGNRQELINKLLEMYSEPISKLLGIDGDEESGEKKGEWVVIQ